MHKLLKLRIILITLCIIFTGVAAAQTTSQQTRIDPEQHKFISTDRPDGRYLSTRGLVQDLMRNTQPQLAFNPRFSRDEFIEWQTKVREKMQELMNFPDVPPQPQPKFLSKVKRAGYTVEKWEIYPQPGSVVPFLMLIPDGVSAQSPAPAVLCLPEWPIGADGTLLEWADDVEGNQAHRHLSHLYPLFPASLFDLEKKPELIRAAVQAIKKREKAFLEDACGWSYSWLVLLYARAGMAEDAYHNLLIYTKGFVTADNFLSTISDISGLGFGRTWHKQLIQVEAGLGITAAIAEMLLQSHNGLIRILPANSIQIERCNHLITLNDENYHYVNVDLPNHSFKADVVVPWLKKVLYAKL